MILQRKFYATDTLKVAEKLLGKILVHKSVQGTLIGKIVETEAYIGETDPACHAARGKTPRNHVMYGPPGHAYVYFTYGMHFMLNFVTEQDGFPAAVLIRALEPLEGIEVMQKNRKDMNLYNLTSGPGKLCQAFGINTALNGVDLCGGSQLVVKDTREEAAKVIWTPRVGITAGGDRLWRCYLADNPFASKSSFNSKSG